MQRDKLASRTVERERTTVCGENRVSLGEKRGRGPANSRSIYHCQPRFGFSRRTARGFSWFEVVSPCPRVAVLSREPTSAASRARLIAGREERSATSRRDDSETILSLTTFRSRVHTALRPRGGGGTTSQRDSSLFLNCCCRRLCHAVLTCLMGLRNR